MIVNATILQILLGTNDIGDRDYTLVFQFKDDEGRDAVGFYTYEKKSLYEKGQTIQISCTEMTERERKRICRKHKDMENCIGGHPAYKAEPVNAEQYLDPNAYHFTKNQYPGDRSMLLYSAMLGAAALIALLGFYLAR